MDVSHTDPLRRYTDFSEKCCRLNEVLAMAKDLIAANYAASDAEDVYLLNDLALFLTQVMAFDGFVTVCSHWLGWTEARKRQSLVQRVKDMAGAGMQQDKSFERLRSGITEISEVRDLWIHRQGDPSVVPDPQWPGHLRDRFGLYEKDGRWWVRLSKKARDGKTPWFFVVATLSDTAKCLWEVVGADVTGAMQGTGRAGARRSISGSILTRK